MGRRRRSSALLIRVSTDEKGGQAWYASLVAYRDELSVGMPLPSQSTVDGISDMVQMWLADVLNGDEAPLNRAAR